MSADRYFDRSTLDPVALAEDISGDLGIGPDRGIWQYEGGVWRPAPEEIEYRTVHALGSRFKPAHVATVEPVIRH